MANALFYLTAFGVIALSLGVILSKNPVMGVLSLLGSFFCLATIYLLAGFQFLAAAQILVYAGAIMVLFLFVIMLLNLGEDTRSKIIDTDVLKQRRLGAPGLVVAGVLVAGLVAIAGSKLPQFVAALNETGIGSPTELAGRLFVEHALAFQGIGILLLVTTVAVLVLAKRDRGDSSEPAPGGLSEVAGSAGGRVDVSERRAELESELQQELGASEATEAADRRKVERAPALAGRSSS